MYVALILIALGDASRVFHDCVRTRESVQCDTQVVVGTCVAESKRGDREEHHTGTYNEGYCLTHPGQLSVERFRREASSTNDR
jgi:hypothetical protein